MGFFSDLFGGGGTDFNEVALQQQAELAGAKKRARNELTTGKTQADAFYEPYATAGLTGFNAYNDAIGINGQEGYARAFKNFNDDPFAAGTQAASNNALMRLFKQYNARGAGNSGASRLAGARAAQETYGQRVADYRNRLMGQGQQGYGASSSRANLAYGHAGNLASLEQGHGQQMAQIWGNAANAEQQQKTQGVNNVLGLAGNLGGAVFKLAGM